MVLSTDIGTGKYVKLSPGCWYQRPNSGADQGVGRSLATTVCRCSLLEDYRPVYHQYGFLKLWDAPEASVKRPGKKRRLCDRLFDCSAFACKIATFWGLKLEWVFCLTKLLLTEIGICASNLASLSWEYVLNFMSNEQGISKKLRCQAKFPESIQGL